MDNRKGIIVVVVLFVLAALIFGRYLWSSQQDHQLVTEAPREQVEQRIREIEKDPNMPPQAKAIAIGQLRSRMSGGARGGGAPVLQDKPHK